MTHSPQAPSGSFFTPAFNYAESSNALQGTLPTVSENEARKDAENLSANNSSSSAVIEGMSRQGPKFYCLRPVVQLSECLNTNVLDCSVTFCVDKNICVLGVQVPTQIVVAVS